ncbi:MAG TPA: methylmalonyl-CoA epimerase [Actinomycetota bacterium]|nr:methylmalonyl-CoA epimerase [Actinomycetota bacterium]
MLRRIDHVAFAVADLDAAIHLYESAWGLTLAHREVVADQGVEEAMFALGDSYVQLIAPLSGSSTVAKFLERRGEGLHHIAYEVDDLSAELAAAVDRGQRLIDKAPREGGRGTRIAFVHPVTNHGVLVELVEYQ